MNCVKMHFFIRFYYNTNVAMYARKKAEAKIYFKKKIHYRR